MPTTSTSMPYGAEDPGGVGQGGLGEREQRVGRELPALRQQDSVYDPRRLEAGSQAPAVGQRGDRPDEALQHGRRPGDQALRRDEAPAVSASSTYIPHRCYVSDLVTEVRQAHGERRVRSRMVTGMARSSASTSSL